MRPVELWELELRVLCTRGTGPSGARGLRAPSVRNTCQGSSSKLMRRRSAISSSAAGVDLQPHDVALAPVVQFFGDAFQHGAALFLLHVEIAVARDAECARLRMRVAAKHRLQMRLRSDHRSRIKSCRPSRSGSAMRPGSERGIVTTPRILRRCRRLSLCAYSCSSKAQCTALCSARAGRDAMDRS